MHQTNQSKPVPLSLCMSAGDRGATIYETEHHASRESVRIVNALYPEINPQYSAVIRAVNSHADLVTAIEMQLNPMIDRQKAHDALRAALAKARA